MAYLGFSVPDLSQTVLKPKVPTGHGELGLGGLGTRPQQCSSAVLSRRCVSDAASHQDRPLGMFGREGGMFQSYSQPGGVTQLQASLTAFTCGLSTWL